MNICIINVDYKPEFVGGILRVSSILAHEWIKKHTVYFLTITPSSIRRDTVKGIPQFFLPDSKIYNSDTNLDFVLNFIKNKNIDILINQHIEEREICDLCFKVRKMINVKLISVLHFSIIHKKNVVKNSFFISYKLDNIIKRYLTDFLLFCKFWLYKNAKNEKEEGLYYRFVYENSDATVLLSEKYKPIFIKKTNLKDYSKLIAINNPSLIDFDELVDLKEKENVVVWCGRLGYDAKRTDKILSIWKKVSKCNDWQLKILGSGDVDYFNRLINKYDIHNVEIVGFCNPIEYYKKASIFCLTSVTEGLPMVLIESMSYGCVPIAYNSFASLTDIINDGENGYIVKAFDEKEYIVKLKDLMDNKSKRLEMAKKGRIHMRKFNSEIISEKWIDLFNNLFKY